MLRFKEFLAEDGATGYVGNVSPHQHHINALKKHFGKSDEFHSHLDALKASKPKNKDLHHIASEVTGLGHSFNRAKTSQFYSGMTALHNNASTQNRRHEYAKEHMPI